MCSMFIYHLLRHTISQNRIKQNDKATLTLQISCFFLPFQLSRCIMSESFEMERNLIKFIQDPEQL